MADKENNKKASEPQITEHKETSLVSDEVYAEMCRYSYINVKASLGEDKEEFEQGNIVALEGVDGYESLDGWYIADVYDNQPTGVYAVTFVNDEGNAVVAVRGSEPPKNIDFHGIMTDWLVGDFELVNSTETEYQKDVLAYVNSDRLMGVLEGNNCTTLDLTGHSLGNSGVSHAYIHADDEIRPYLSRCIGFDGPGVSQEYIDENYALFQQYGSEITEYRYSGFGYLLNEYPCINYVNIKVDKDENSLLDEVLLCHDLNRIQFVDGSVIEDTEIPAAEVLYPGELTREIDAKPDAVGNFMVYALEGLACLLSMYKEGIENCLESVKTKNYQQLDVNEELNYLIRAQVLIISQLYLLGEDMNSSIELTAWLFYILRIKDSTAEYLLSIFGEYLKEHYNWSDMDANSFIEGVLRVNTEVGATERKSATGHSELPANIRMDTYKLRQYAQRLEAVNRKIIELDRRMDALYMQTKWADLGKLLRTDMLTGECWRLKQCIAYLNDTADDFEEAEREIKNAFS